MVAFPAIRGEQLHFLDPVEAVMTKDVRRARIRAEVVGEHGADDHGVAADRDGPAEPVVGCPVRRQQLGLLDPRPGFRPMAEDVDRTGGVPSVVVVAVGPDDRDVAADCHGLPEQIFGQRVCADQHRLLNPGRAVVAVHVGRIGIESAHDGDVAADINLGAEEVTGRAVRGQELLDLALARRWGDASGKERGECDRRAPCAIKCQCPEHYSDHTLPSSRATSIHPQ